MTAEKVRFLRDALLEEIFRMMNLKPAGLSRRLIQPLLSWPARRFSELAVNFDEQVGEHGLVGGVRWLAPHFIHSVSAKGLKNIPQEGPLLITSNHPGTYDGLAIMKFFPREDLKLVATGVTFVRSLQNTAQYLIFAPRDDLTARMLAIRQMIRSLKNGEAVLIFPHGNVEPDPAHSPEAKAALEKWSASLETVLRKAPETKVLVTAVSNVVEKRYTRHLLTRLTQNQYSRQKLAEVVQISQQLILNARSKLVPRVIFSNPQTCTELQQSTGQTNPLASIIEQTRRLMDEPFLTTELP